MDKSEKSGVLLPGVDPNIGEIVLATLQANPQATPAQVAVALAQQAPSPEIATELVSALMELLVCREKGHLYWLDVTGQSILIGARRVLGRDALTFGHSTWPLAALMASTPKSVTVDTGAGRRRVWLACEGLDGVVLRMSEVVALGNLMVEAFGARVIEDRAGPQVMRDSYIEANMSKRAKARAEALSSVEKLTVDSNANPELRPGHARVALAEALPGSCRDGLELHPEGEPSKVYVVERRVNESWVSIVAKDPGKDANVEPSAWVRVGSPDIGPLEGADRYWGFTDEPATAAVPALPRFIGTLDGRPIFTAPGAGNGHPPPDHAERVQEDDGEAP